MFFRSIISCRRAMIWVFFRAKSWRKTPISLRSLLIESRIDVRLPVGICVICSAVDCIENIDVETVVVSTSTTSSSAMLSVGDLLTGDETRQDFVEAAIQMLEIELPWRDIKWLEVSK